MDQTAQTSGQQLRQVMYRWFVAPYQLPEDALEAKHARLLAFYMLCLLLGSGINFLVAWMSATIVPSTFLVIIASVSLYSASRVLPYKAVAIATVLTSLSIPFISLIISPHTLTFLAIIFLFTVTLLISSQFLSFRSTLQVSILVIISIFILTTIDTIIGTVEPAILLVPVIITVILILLNTFGREYLLDFAQRNDDPRTETFFGNALQLLSDAAFIQVDKVIVDANSAASRLLGLEYEALIGRRVTDFVSTGSSTNYRLDQDAEHLIIRYDDQVTLAENQSIQNVAVTARSIPYGEGIATLMILRPIEQDDESSILREILEASEAAVIVTDADLTREPRIVMGNPALRELSQYRLRELIGQSIYTLLDDKSADVSSALKIITRHHEAKQTIQSTSRCKDGSIIPTSWTISAVSKPDGKISHFIFSQQAETLSIGTEVTVEGRESTFRLISELLSDYAYSLAVDEQDRVRIAWVAGDVYGKIGLSKTDVLQLDGWESRIHEDDRAFYNLRIGSLLKGDTSHLEYRLMDANGGMRWIEDIAHPLIDETTGRVVRILCAATDITERVRAQDNLKAHVVQQAVVSELGLLALNSHDLLQITQHAAVLCEQVLSVGLVAIHEHDARAEELECISLSRSHVPFQIGERISDHYLSSLAAYTLHSHEAVISEDLADESRFKPRSQVLNENYGSGVGIVILGSNHMPFGTLTIFSSLTHDFSHDEIYFLQSVANVLGTFIERNRAQIAEREQAEFAEALRAATAVINSQLELREVLKKIISYLKQVVPQAHQASIMLMDDTVQGYRHWATWGFADDSEEANSRSNFSMDDFPLLKLMFDTEQALYIVDTEQDHRWMARSTVEKTRSYIGAPIIVNNEVIGFINLHGFVVGAFTEADAIRLKTFAETTSTAIVNARKQEELEHKVIQRTAELKEQSDKLSTILAGTGDGIFYSDNDIIAYVNDTLCQMTGYSANELLNQRTAILSPDNLSTQEVTSVENSAGNVFAGDTWRNTSVLSRKDGSTFEAAFTITRVASSSQEVLRFVAIVRDISAERELEKLKKTFIAAAAHDLRSPISSLQMRMHMIKRQPEKMDYHMERLTYIIERMNRLVNDLLDAHGRIVLRPQNVILQSILDQVADVLELEASEKYIAFNYDSPTEPITILADNHRLEQVFFNLITNAINYTDAKGQITIRYRIDNVAQVVMIDIQDTGLGIPQDEQENIFLPFYRALDNDRKGNGLGLSITREIVELHSGHISVVSVAGKGSTFTVALPLLLTEGTTKASS